MTIPQAQGKAFSGLHPSYKLKAAMGRMESERDLPSVQKIKITKTINSMIY